jgi:general secretion pathway protein A
MTHPSYMEFFKLRSQPFSEHSPSELLWNDTRMEEALARLQHLVQSGLLGLVTGASGLGKSALLKRFIADQSPQHCTPIYCHLAHLPSNGLLKVVLTQLGEIPRRGKDKLYSQLMDRARRVEGTLLLIFDEAHLLSGEALVDLRLLVSSAIEQGPPMKILLCGQDHLRQTLKRSEYTDIVNRISIRYQLRPLTKEQTRRYIDFQMKEHGGDVKVFDDGAKDLIHDFTGGNLRGINNASIVCLMGATGRGQLRIDEEMFRTVSNELVLH